MSRLSRRTDRRTDRRRLRSSEDYAFTNYLSIVCTCYGRFKMLKSFGYDSARLDATAPRFRAWVRPMASLDNLRDEKVERAMRRYAHVVMGAASAPATPVWAIRADQLLVGPAAPTASIDGRELVLVVDEPFAPAIFQQTTFAAWTDEDADRLAKDGFEHVYGKSNGGLPYSYYKARLRCPQCRRDVTLGPERVDQLVRDLHANGVSRCDLGFVIRYSQGQ